MLHYHNTSQINLHGRMFTRRFFSLLTGRLPLRYSVESNFISASFYKIQQEIIQPMYVCMYMYVRTYAGMYLFLLHLSPLFMQVCIYAFMQVCMYVCMYVRMYACMYVWVNTRFPLSPKCPKQKYGDCQSKSLAKGGCQSKS